MAAAADPASSGPARLCEPRLWPWRLPRRLLRSPGYRLRRAALAAARPLLADPRRLVTLTTAAGPRMALDLADELDAQIFLFGGYDPETSLVARHLLRLGEQAIDAGANIGYFALLLAAAAGPTGLVAAFEPLPPTFRRLLASARLNPACRIDAVCAALSDATGTATLRQGFRQRSGDAVLWPPGAPPADPAAAFFGARFREQRVPLDTIDRYTARSGLLPALIKIDVEGAEPAVLRGAERTLRACRPLLILEVSDLNLARFGDTPEGLLGRLGDAFGYSVRWIDRAGLPPLDLAAARAGEPAALAALRGLNRNALAYLPETHGWRVEQAARALAAARLPRRDFEVRPQAWLARRADYAAGSRRPALMSAAPP